MNDKWEEIKWKHECMTFQKFGSEGIGGDSGRREFRSGEAAFKLVNFLDGKV